MDRRQSILSRECMEQIEERMEQMELQSRQLREDVEQLQLRTRLLSSAMTEQSQILCSSLDPRNWGSIMSEEEEEEEPSPPATKTSIEALPIVEIAQEAISSECAICLLDFQVGEKVKEMPCKHRYHSDCINKWLEIHGSCPVCRYKMEKETPDLVDNLD